MAGGIENKGNAKTMIILLVFLSLISFSLWFYLFFRQQSAIVQHATNQVIEKNQQLKEREKLIEEYEAITVRLYRRINELEARCYRQRRKLNERGGEGGPVVIVNKFDILEWMN